MKITRTITEWMNEQNMSFEKLLQSSSLERSIVEAILQARYTPSPQQRERLAAALQVAPDQIAWGHREQVQHLYGHGTQWGRSP